MVSRRGAPWWIYACAAVFLGYFLLNFGYFQFFGWELPGVSSPISRDFAVAQAVLPGSPADRAGIRPGDRLLSFGGYPIRTIPDYGVAIRNSDPSKPIDVEIDRAGTPLHMQLTFRRNYQTLFSGQGIASIFWLLGSVLELVLAFVIIFNRPYDFSARLGALFLASFACNYYPLVMGDAVIWRALPLPLQVAFLPVNILANNLWWFLLFLFFAVFPRKIFHNTLTWVAVCAVPAIVGVVSVVGEFGMVYFPAWVLQLRLSPATIRTGVLTMFGIISAYVMAGMGCLVWNYRLGDVNERRRIRLLVIGVIITMVAFHGVGVLGVLISTVGLQLGVQIVAAALSLVFPICFAYVILKHRLFDVRVMIRQGVRYAAARGVLLYLVPVLIGILLLDLVRHKDQTVGALLAQRGWLYAALAVVAGVAHLQRQSWMQALDRRFFRERYNAQQVLRELVEEIRKAVSLEEEAPRAVARIESALHPEFAALLVHNPGEACYRCIASAPSGVALTEVNANSKLIGLMRLLGKPLHASASDSGWLHEQLPHEETDFLRQARIEMLVPVALAPDSTEAVLAFGQKRSEEPYTEEDQELLLAIAGALALLLERPAGAPTRAAYGECMECGACYDSGTYRCSSDGAPLTPMPFPRMLAGRYRLEKRLGRGGMGTVYRAADVALEREVAVKMLREDLIANPQAAERFRREARMSASISHPNLVAIHDFGIEAGRGGFLVMELLVGRTLRQQLLQRGRLPTPHALEILRGVCSAVEAAHKRNLIHRDLKPENIFLAQVGDAEIPKVLDFGVAKLVSQVVNSAMPTADTGDGVLLGTAQYMSPEQLRGGSVEPSWDVWALAVITYEMLTGTHPFLAPAIASVHAAVLEGRFRPVRNVLADAPPALEEFFAAAFVRDQTRRPESANDLLSKLELSLSANAARRASPGAE